MDEYHFYEGSPEREEKKRDPAKRTLIKFGVILTALTLVISLAGGAGGAYLTLRYYTVNPPAEETEENLFVPEEVFTPPAETTSPEEETESPIPETTLPETTAEQTTEQITEPPTDQTTEAPAVTVKKTKGEIYAEAVHSIVGIRATRTEVTQGFFGRYSTREVNATGSGFFFTADGYIVTNYHVIENAETIRVSTYDGGSYEAKVRGYDKDNDLAVLKIEGVFAPAEIGASSSLCVGDDILVIGNPLGDLSYTFTDGVVSYLNRVITGDTGTAINMFQTNAAINEGNSGGPVYDETGRVVGIASAKYASSSIEGLGFCIPIDDVAGKIRDIIGAGYVTGKPEIGVSVQSVNTAMSLRYDIPVGCYVVAVGDGSAADEAGVLAADVITEIDGYTVTSAEDLSALLTNKKAGDEISIKVSRAGSLLLFTFPLGEKTTDTPRTEYSNVFDF